MRDFTYSGKSAQIPSNPLSFVPISFMWPSRAFDWGLHRLCSALFFRCTLVQDLNGFSFFFFYGWFAFFFFSLVAISYVRRAWITCNSKGQDLTSQTALPRSSFPIHTLFGAASAHEFLWTCSFICIVCVFYISCKVTASRNSAF